MASLERIEKYLVIFLALTLLAGALLLIYLRSRPPEAMKIRNFSAEKLSGPRPPAPSARININKADAEELTALKGIGKALAGRIVEDRASKGYFLMKDDIMRVEGIGPVLYEKIKDEIDIE